MSSAARRIERIPNPSPLLKIVRGKQKLSDLKIGLAAEYLVCADLILSGREVLRTDQSAAYDLVADTRGWLVRVQVKATAGAKQCPQENMKHVLGYTWHCKRGNTMNIRPYVKGEFDILALVALDSKRIAYIHQSEAKQIIQIHVSGNLKTPIRTFDSCTFDHAMMRMGGARRPKL